METYKQQAVKPWLLVLHLCLKSCTMASGLQSVVTTSGTTTMVLPLYVGHSGSLEALTSKHAEHTVQIQCQSVHATLEKHYLPALVVAMAGVISNTAMVGARLAHQSVSL